MTADGDRATSRWMRCASARRAESRCRTTTHWTSTQQPPARWTCWAKPHAPCIEPAWARWTATTAEPGSRLLPGAVAYRGGQQMGAPGLGQGPDPRAGQDLPAARGGGGMVSSPALLSTLRPGTLAGSTQPFRRLRRTDNWPWRMGGRLGALGRTIPPRPAPHGWAAIDTRTRPGRRRRVRHTWGAQTRRLQPGRPAAGLLAASACLCGAGSVRHGGPRGHAHRQRLPKAMWAC
jgi:hypothetical protein